MLVINFYVFFSFCFSVFLIYYTNNHDMMYSCIHTHCTHSVYFFACSFSASFLFLFFWFWCSLAFLNESVNLPTYLIMLTVQIFFTCFSTYLFVTVLFERRVSTSPLVANIGDGISLLELHGPETVRGHLADSGLKFYFKIKRCPTLQEHL